MFKSIKSKFIFTVLTLGIATLLLSGLVNHYITSKTITAEVKEKLESVPKQMGRNIESMLYFQWLGVQLYSSFLSAADAGADVQKTEMMRRITSMYVPYSLLTVISEEGTILYSSDLELVGLNISDEHWFINVRDTLLTQIHDVRYSQLFYDRSAIQFTSPIYGPNRSFKGAVHSEIGVDYIANNIRNLKIGKTGYLLLVRKDGKVIADSSEYRYGIEEDVSALRAFKLASEGESGMIRERDMQGSDSFISYLPLRGFMEYPGLGWSVLAIQSAEEVLAYPRRQTKATALIIVAGIAIFSIGGLIEAKGITGPITKIFNQVSQFSKGDLSQPLDVKSNDELGELARSFNSMAQSLMERERDLRSARNYLENLVSSSVDTIITTDVNGRITFMNAAAEEVLGCKRSEARERDISEFYRGGKEEFSRIMERLHAQGNYKSYETEIVRMDGRRVPMSISASLLRDEKGEIIGVLGIGKDLTETKKLQSQVIHQEKMAGLGMLAAGIAHEIGNPLTSLSSLVQMMRRRERDSNLSQKLDLMGEHIERISKIVRELVDFSRPPSYQWKYTQVNDIIRAAVGLMNYDKRRKSIQVETHLDPHLPMIKVIEDQLLQVFLNIILNAFDAMEEGGKLIIRSTTENGQVKIAFEDTGVGIKKENLERIFEPFFSTKEVGRGTGLGLTVSYGVVKNLKGEITVQSEARQGAVFTVSLPITERDGDA